MSDSDARALAVRELVVAQLRAGRPAELLAAGQSMWPTIRDGARVTLLPFVGADVPRVGDVVLYLAPRGLVLHRVLRRDPTHITTKGDAEPAPDFAVAPNAILGRLARRPGDALRAALSARVGPRTAPLLRRVRQLEALLFRRSAG